MPTENLSFKDTGYFSNLICDYLQQKEALDPFFNRFPDLNLFEEQIKEKQSHYSQGSRAVLCEVLSKQYSNIKESNLAKKHIELLGNKDTFTITTGHQLNLFTGPLYFLYKILSVVNLCKTLKVNYPGKNFVPVFWMASEDHDFKEICFFNFRGQKVNWNRSTSGAVGRLDNQGLDEVYKVYASELGNTVNATFIKSLFEKAYLKHGNLADATRFLANELFKDYGLVVLDADDAQLKRLFIPQLKKELINEVTYEKVIKTNSELQKLGYKVQVNPREINLFYLQKNLRERLIKANGKFIVNNTNLEFSEKEILDDLDARPSCYSPNVLMRPLYQEVILPNLCYVGGGGEMAYWFQLKESFKAQNVPFPMLLLRDSVVIRTTKQRDKQVALGISDKDLFLNKNDFINKYVRRISNINIDFSSQEAFLKEHFETMYTLAEQTDKSFLGAVKAQEVKQLKGLKHLEKRLLKAQKKVLADKVVRSMRLKDELFPNESLQERQMNFSELYLEYGEAFIEILAQHLNPLDMRFLLLTI